MGALAGWQVVRGQRALTVLLCCFWLIAALRSAYGPLMTGGLNQKIPEQSKATMFSLYGPADSGGQVLFGPAVGGLASALTIGVALACSALVLLPAAVLLGRSREPPTPGGA